LAPPRSAAHSGESRNLHPPAPNLPYEIPACAGMSGFLLTALFPPFTPAKAGVFFGFICAPSGGVFKKCCLRSGRYGGI